MVYPNKPSFHLLNGHSFYADFNPAGWKSDYYRITKSNGAYDVTRESDRAITAHVSTHIEAVKSAKSSILKEWDRFRAGRIAANGPSCKCGHQKGDHQFYIPYKCCVEGCDCERFHLTELEAGNADA